MQRYKLFEKTTPRFQSKSRNMNGGSVLPPSPADDPLDRLDSVRERLKSASDDTEDTGQFDVSKAGAKASGIPRWAMGLFAVLVGVGVAAAGTAWALHLFWK